MTDILTELADAIAKPTHYDLMEKAFHEIERLRARVEELEGVLNRIAESTCSDDPCRWMVDLARAIDAATQPPVPPVERSTA